MQEIICSVGAPDETGANPSSGFVIGASPVVTEVDLGPPVWVEVVSERAAKPGRHIGDVLAGGIVEITERRRYRAAWMQPLITHKQIPFRICVVLRKRGARHER